MALRTKSVEFPFVTNTAALALTTRYDFTAITLYVPETTSRTFRSAFIEVTAREDSATVTSMTAWLLGIKLGAVAFDDATVTETLVNTGEHQSFIFQRDVTSYFATNFGAGATQTCQVGVLFTATPTINIAAKLVVTYEYDDAAQTTRVKTVKIPIESPVDLLTTTLTELGTNQVPLLDTFLPEASKVFRHIWFEITGNEGMTTTTNFQLGMQLDSATEVLDGVHHQELNTGVWYRFIWVQNSMTTSAAHAFKLRTASAAAMSHPAVVLCVTYEYNHTTSTSIMNSVQFSIGQDQTYIGGGTTSAAQQRFQKKFFIEEPATIALVQSGIYLGYLSSSSTGGPSVAAGSQATRLYVHISANSSAGMFDLMQRIDSGAAQGAGMTLARGEVTVTVDVFATAAGTLAFTGVTALLYLNYTSGKATNGADTHNHTIQLSALTSTNITTAYRTIATIAPNIPETDYYANAIGATLRQISTGGSTAIALAAEILSGEGAADGWLDLASSTMETDPEILVHIAHWGFEKHFRKYPTDPITARLALETSRTYHLTNSRLSVLALSLNVTYHAITNTVAGTIAGYTGDGSGITVDVFRADTREWVGSVTSAAGGTYTFTWFDNVTNVYTVTRQDASHMGRSDNATAA